MTIEQHLSDFHELWNNEKALIWSTHSPKKSVSESKALMLTTLPDAENPNIEKFAILLRPNKDFPEPYVNETGEPKMIGLVGTNRVSEQGLEVGYCLNIRYWGRGYAGEAFRAFLELYWGMDERKDIKTLVAKIDPDNLTSEKIVRRVGARRGEVLEKRWARPGDVEAKRDLVCWYIDRPGFRTENLPNKEDKSDGIPHSPIPVPENVPLREMTKLSVRTD